MNIIMIPYCTKSHQVNIDNMVQFGAMIKEA